MLITTLQNMLNNDGIAQIDLTIKNDGEGNGFVICNLTPNTLNSLADAQQIQLAQPIVFSLTQLNDLSDVVANFMSQKTVWQASDGAKKTKPTSKPNKTTTQSAEQTDPAPTSTPAPVAGGLFDHDEDSL
jgi:hypothetical protein